MKKHLVLLLSLSAVSSVMHGMDQQDPGATQAATAALARSMTASGLGAAVAAARASETSPTIANMSAPVNQSDASAVFSQAASANAATPAGVIAKTPTKLVRMAKALGTAFGFCFLLGKKAISATGRYAFITTPTYLVVKPVKHLVVEPVNTIVIQPSIYVGKAAGNLLLAICRGLYNHRPTMPGKDAVKNLFARFNFSAKTEVGTAERTTAPVAAPISTPVETVKHSRLYRLTRGKIDWVASMDPVANELQTMHTRQQPAAASQANATN